MYKSLESQIGELMSRTVKTLTNQEMSDKPSTSLCAHMAHELGLLSSIHLVEFMLQSSNLCLSWDATSLDGDHINEIHVSANDNIWCWMSGIFREDVHLIM